MTEAMTLGYDETGERDEVLLLIHGFPFDRTMWAEQLEGLAGFRRVIAPDLRGRGKSPTGANEWSIDTHADDLAATLDELEIDRVDLAGLSMGGYIAFAFLRRYRDRVRSLILMDTKAGADADEAKQGREKAAASALEGGTIALADGLMPKLFAPQTSDDIKAKVQLMFESVPGETSAADALAMRDRPDSTPDLATIEVPTLVIHGEEDVLMPVEVGRDLAAAIPGATFAGIARGGHVCPMENPADVNGAIKGFFKGG